MSSLRESRRSVLARDTIAAIGRARTHEAFSMRERIEEGPRSAVVGLGILGVQCVPSVFGEAVGAMLVGLDKRVVGAGGESIVFKKPGDQKVVKLTPVSGDSAPRVEAQFIRDLRIAREVFGPEVVADTAIRGVVDGRVGFLKGPFVVQEQEAVDGVPLVNNLADASPKLTKRVRAFIDGFYHAIDSHGVIPDIIRPENVLLTDDDRIRLVDYSMFNVEGNVRRLDPEPHHEGILNENLSKLLKVAA